MVKHQQQWQECKTYRELLQHGKHNMTKWCDSQDLVSLNDFVNTTSSVPMESGPLFIEFWIHKSQVTQTLLGKLEEHKFDYQVIKDTSCCRSQAHHCSQTEDIGLELLHHFCVADRWLRVFVDDLIESPWYDPLFHGYEHGKQMPDVMKYVHQKATSNQKLMAIRQRLKAIHTASEPTEASSLFQKLIESLSKKDRKTIKKFIDDMTGTWYRFYEYRNPTEPMPNCYFKKTECSCIAKRLIQDGEIVRMGRKHL